MPLPAVVIAAEKTGRICHALELDPRYVDIAVRRWQRLTGKTAVRAESGQTFEEVAVTIEPGTNDVAKQAGGREVGNDA